MEDLNKLILEALDRYFNVLEKVGYSSDDNKLLLLLFLGEFLEQYKYYITEQDYTTIGKIIQCLSSSSCLVPFMEYQQMSIPLTGYVRNIPIRITEYDNIRTTQPDISLRLVNQ